MLERISLPFAVGIIYLTFTDRGDFKYSHQPTAIPAISLAIITIVKWIYFEIKKSRVEMGSGDKKEKTNQ